MEQQRSGVDRLIELTGKRGNGEATPGELGEWNAGVDPGPIAPRQWLLSNQFCRGFISSLVAAGGVGKSALRLLQFISLALGKSLCGQHIFRRCRVLLISLEDDTDELQRRIKAVLDHFQIDRSELDGWLFCATPEKMSKLAELKDKKRSVGPLEQQIRDAIVRRQPDLVSLDPFVKIHALEENDSGDMDFVCDLLARFAVEFGIAVDSPHHVHKGQLTPGDADSGRGSSGIRDAGRLVYTLAPMSEAEAQTFGIDLEDRCTYVRLDAAKVNIAARSGTATWFHMIGVPIGNATVDYPNGDTVQVVEPWSPPDIWTDLSDDLLNQILTAIDAGLGDGNFYTAANNATDRAAWRVVKRFAPDKPDGQARQMIAAWLRTGLLLTFDYTNPQTRKDVKGLRVDSTKRPGTKL
jgi:AAA domain